jgi:hypothetical protein
MSLIKSLKAQAENLMVALAEDGVKVEKGKALDFVARQYGFVNWDTLCAAVLEFETSKKAPTLADLQYRPMHAWVEQDGVEKSYVIEGFEGEGMPLLGDVAALTDFVAKHPSVYEKGLDSDAIYLLGDGHDVSFTFRELMGINPELVDDTTYWSLTDGKRVIRFDEEPVYRDTFELTIPKVTRSIKGTELIALRSSDGSFYDHFAMVPPHLNVEKLRTKISDGLTKMKEADAANRDDSDKEYTEIDVKKLIEGLGLLWVASPQEVGQNWDA